MSAPVRVKAYSDDGAVSEQARAKGAENLQPLPPISAYAFSNIVSSVDSEDFQQAIDDIAEICAKGRMSFSDEHPSHLPPFGEITVASPGATRSHANRPGKRRALTSVPEASPTQNGSSKKTSESGSSEKTSGCAVVSRRSLIEQLRPVERLHVSINTGAIRIVSPWFASVSSAAVLAPQLSTDTNAMAGARADIPPAPARRSNEAAASLQRFLPQERGDEVT